MPALERRRFDHLAAELSVALSLLVPRHALWLAAAAHLASAQAAAAFCDAPLDAFLDGAQLPELPTRARVRLRRIVARFDATQRTPEEILGALFSRRASH
jgi:hypothetical protein